MSKKKKENRTVFVTARLTESENRDFMKRFNVKNRGAKSTLVRQLLLNGVLR
jgi:hypothetical protein